MTPSGPTVGASDPGPLKLARKRFERYREIDLRAPRKVDPLSHGYQKGRAVVPMANLAAAALLEARAGAQTDYVIEWAGRPVKSIKKAFATTAQKAGLGHDVSPHTLRHTAATLMADTAPMEQVARFLGHRDPRTTRSIYAKPGAKSLGDAAKAVDIKVIN